MSIDRIALIKRTSRKLLLALVCLAVLLFLLLWVAWRSRETFTLPAVMLAGVVGGFVSLQRRIKTLSNDDLQLMAESSLYTWLAPITGGLLASVLHLLFLSGLLAGTLFPEFKASGSLSNDTHGLVELLHMHCEKPEDYGKLLFWSFVAGFSEKFVVDIIGQFEQGATRNKGDT